MTIDINKLKKALMDYYGTAMHSGFSMAVVELGKIENASPENLVKLAVQAGFNLKDFAIDDIEHDMV